MAASSTPLTGMIPGSLAGLACNCRYQPSRSAHSAPSACGYPIASTRSSMRTGRSCTVNNLTCLVPSPMRNHRPGSRAFTVPATRTSVPGGIFGRASRGVAGRLNLGSVFSWLRISTSCAPAIQSASVGLMPAAVRPDTKTPLARTNLFSNCGRVLRSGSKIRPTTGRPPATISSVR